MPNDICAVRARTYGNIIPADADSCSVLYICKQCERGFVVHPIHNHSYSQYPKFKGVSISFLTELLRSLQPQSAHITIQVFGGVSEETSGLLSDYLT